MTDFDTFLAETGLTHQQVEGAKRHTQFVKLPGVSAARVKVAASKIEGLGLLARTDLEPGESFEAFADQQWTETGRFANHSATPSAIVKATGHGFAFVLVKPLKTGEELTVNYRHVKSVCLNFGSQA